MTEPNVQGSEVVPDSTEPVVEGAEVTPAPEPKVEEEPKKAKRSKADKDAAKAAKKSTAPSETGNIGPGTEDLGNALTY